jgi:hypothetical protein
VKKRFGAFSSSGGPSDRQRLRLASFARFAVSPNKGPFTTLYPGKNKAPENGGRIYGGERGIRTLGGVAPSLVFETSTFNHSVTSPSAVLKEERRRGQSFP